VNLTDVVLEYLSMFGFNNIVKNTKAPNTVQSSGKKKARTVACGDGHERPNYYCRKAGSDYRPCRIPEHRACSSNVQTDMAISDHSKSQVGVVYGFSLDQCPEQCNSNTNCNAWEHSTSDDGETMCILSGQVEEDIVFVAIAGRSSGLACKHSRAQCEEVDADSKGRKGSKGKGAKSGKSVKS